MYYKDQQGKWVQHPTIYHLDAGTIEQDLKHPFVFVAESFYYFGDKAVTIPDVYQNLVWKRQGCKRNHDPKVVESFLNWLKVKNCTSGVLGNPKDNDAVGTPSCHKKCSQRTKC